MDDRQALYQMTCIRVALGLLMTLEKGVCRCQPWLLGRVVLPPPQYRSYFFKWKIPFSDKMMMRLDDTVLNIGIFAK